MPHNFVCKILSLLVFFAAAKIFIVYDKEQGILDNVHFRKRALSHLLVAAVFDV